MSRHTPDKYTLPHFGVFFKGNCPSGRGWYYWFCPTDDLPTNEIGPFETDEQARLSAKAPETTDALRSLITEVSRLNSYQHAGIRVSAKDWAGLYQQTNEARAILAEIDRPVDTLDDRQENRADWIDR